MSNEEGSSNADFIEQINQMAIQIQEQKNWTYVQACRYVQQYYANYMSKTPYRTSILIGGACICELYDGHVGRFEENVCMPKHVFSLLCDTLVRDFGLCVNQRSHGLAVEKNVAMFVHVLRGFKNRAIQERFQHSGETVSCHVHNVLEAMKKFTVVHCRPTTNQNVRHPHLRSKMKYLPFKDYIGAINGTHVVAKVTGPEAATYFGRKYCHTQNIMAVVDFDMCFTFVALG
ncbi:hypothetical protein CsSME_00030336 [Camellia sinensis var. sinensis]